MKFSGKMCFEIILKVTKNQGFTLSVEDTFFEKPQTGVNLTPPPRHIRVNSVKQSAVSDHLLECRCSINFDDFDNLTSDTSKFRFLIKESLLIKRDRPQLNKTIKSFPLKLFD